MNNPDRRNASGPVFPWAMDDHRTIHYYSSLITRYGRDARALGWGGANSQRLRFSVLAGIGNLDGASILDIGCGQGDFLAWLKDAGIDVDYHGIDITPGMIEVARSRFPQAHFTVGNILDHTPQDGSYDYVFASGLFTLRQTEAFAYLCGVVETMMRSCRKGIAFNSLSCWSSQQEAGEYYADPLEVLRFCHSLTPRLGLRHDYHPRDFTLYLYKGNKA